jgi:hypothetical protein
MASAAKSLVTLSASQRTPAAAAALSIAPRYFRATFRVIFSCSPGVA